MESKLDVFETTISKGCILRIEDAEGADITVTAGCLWITQQDDSDDYVLNPGQTFRVSRNGTTIVNALQCTTLRLAHRAGTTGAGLSFGRGIRPLGGRAGRPTLGGWLRDFGRRIVHGTPAGGLA